MNINTCLFYRFSKLCKIVPLCSCYVYLSSWVRFSVEHKQQLFILDIFIYLFYKHRRTHIYVLEGGERDKREHRHIDVGHNSSTLNDSRSVDYACCYEKKVHSLFHHTLQLSVSFWKEMMTNPWSVMDNFGKFNFWTFNNIFKMYQWTERWGSGTYTIWEYTIYIQ